MQEQSQTEVETQSIRASLFRIANPRIADIAFLVVLVVLLVKYNSSISTYHVPISDGAAYLTNAGDWLRAEPLYQIYRPPLISWMIAGVWAITGENWVTVKYLSALFGFASAPVLYLALRRAKGAFFALGVVVLTVLNSEVFFYTSQLLTEGLSLFFLLATLYFVKSERPGYWFLAGVCIGLTFASRYPIALQAGTLALIESFARRNWRILTRAIATAVPAVAAVVIMVFLKTGTFQTALTKDTNFTFLLSPYYVQNSIVAWGWVFLLVPIALILRSTYVNRYNWVFIAWFVFSILFWSANASNFDLRFTIQFTPAVNFLALLAVAAFAKNNEPLRALLKREIPFTNRVSTIADKIPNRSLRTCTFCGRQVRSNDRYCDWCGKPMDSAIDITPSRLKSYSPSRGECE